MGRHRNDGLATDLMNLGFKLPWPVSLGFAVLSYIVLHLVATHFDRAPVATAPGDIAAVVIPSMIHVIAGFLQYIVPLALAIGAIVSLAKSSANRARGGALLSRVRYNQAAEVSSLSWKDFETLIAAGFRRRGYQVAVRGGPTPDGGIDLVLTREKERFLVQCKQWRARSVGVTVIRELYGVMAAEHATGGFVVTSGRYTNEAKAFASGRNIELYDGSKVDELVRDGKPRPADVIQAPALSGPPACPRCMNLMVERVAKRGKHAGKRLWGCKYYPQCDGLIPID